MRYYRYPGPAAVALVLAGACNHPPGSRQDSAKIDLATARGIALAKVPASAVVSEELEQEDGRLVYSFDLRQGSLPGIEEVQIDAHNGSVVSLEHESSSQEAAEAQQDRKKP